MAAIKGVGIGIGWDRSDLNRIIPTDFDQFRGRKADLELVRIGFSLCKKFIKSGKIL